MSGLSSIGSGLASSSTTSAGSGASSSTSLLSSVGQSLLTSGQAPKVGATTANTATAPASNLTSYQAEYLTLQQQDTAELLYASFLDPADALANADSVLGQAAALLGTPGSLPTSLSSSQSTGGTSSSGATGSSSSTSSTSGSTSSTSGTSSSGSGSSTSGTSSFQSLLGFPSVSDILNASNAEADQTLNAYTGAPAGSSILDYQA